MKLAKLAWVEPSGASHVALREPLGEVEPCYAHVAKSCSAWCNVGPFSDSSEAGLANGDTTLSLKFEDLDWEGHAPPILKLCAPRLGPKLLLNGPAWGQVAPCWTQAGPKLKVGPSWTKSGPCWPKLAPKWSACCSHVGSKR